MLQQNNPLMLREDLPRFDLIKPEHFVPALRTTFSEIKEELVKIENNIIPTWEGLCKPLEDLEVPLEYTWGVLEHLISVKNSAELRTALQECLPDFVELTLQISQSKPIYEGLKQIKQTKEYKSYNDAKKELLTLK